MQIKKKFWYVAITGALVTAIAGLVAEEYSGGNVVIFNINDSNKCFLFIHGHRGDTTSTSASAAAEYWKIDEGGYTHLGVPWTVTTDNATRTFDRYYVYGWDSHRLYWDAAWDMARWMSKRVKDCESEGRTNITVVAHSMGNVVLDFIYGNASSGDPYYHYGKALQDNPYSGFTTTEDTTYVNYFKYVKDHVSRSVSVAGPHQGSQLADMACDNGFYEFIADVFMDGCTKGLQSLQTGGSYPVRQYIEGASVPVYLVAGWRKFISFPYNQSSGDLTGTDDGAVAYYSAFFCEPGKSLGTSSQCSTPERAGYKPCDQANENHDDNRNASRSSERRTVSGNKCWKDNNGNYYTSANVSISSSMNIGEMIRCKWGTNPGSACN